MRGDVLIWHEAAVGGCAEHVRSARVFSDINLFRYCNCVIDLDAEIPDCAFDLIVTEQELDSSEVARPSIN